ncbi:response regulator [Mangrovicoccus sp. HB161399]|uniref:response regulator n=1 Tax=Mangrovicoccus sp. HB161399 TaxID=2720392 RepID=UPI0015525B0B|nr:response regulator [Mangrovicoccus sp. HB161399]
MTIGRLMVIDDERSDQMMHERIIRRSGCAAEIVTFTYAPDALGYLRSAEGAAVDGILLDINMPRMTGIEFLEALRAEYGDRTRPVIMILTTSMNPRDRRWAEGFPQVRGFVSKPLARADLEAMARHVAEAG